MKNFYFFALCLISFGLFNYTCSKGDDTGDNVGKSNVLNVNVVNGDSYDLDSVFLLYPGGEEMFIIGKEAYNGGVFSMTLDTPDAVLLVKSADVFPEEVTISNPDVLVFSFHLLYTTKNGNIAGAIMLANSGENEKIDEFANFCYVTEDVGVEGEQVGADKTWKHKYNLSLAEGWNIVFNRGYEEDGYKVTEMSTESVNEVEWYYFEGDS